MSKQAKSKFFYLLPLILFIGVVAFFVTRLDKPAKVAVNTATNNAVPTFSLPSLDNEGKTLTNVDLPSQPYLLNVWGSWCIACSREHPFLVKMQQAGNKIVGVNYKDDPELAKQYLQDEGNPYEFNIKDEDGNLGIDLGLTGAPETFVVDGQGIIRQHIIGEINEENWQTRIQPCLQAMQQNNNSQIETVCQ